MSVAFNTINSYCALSAVLIEKLGTYTVKPVLSGHSKMDKTKVLNTNGSFNEGRKNWKGAYRAGTTWWFTSAIFVYLQIYFVATVAVWV